MSAVLFFRQHKLDESLEYQQFSANVGEEESWINEKNTLVGSDDYGDTLAAAKGANGFKDFLQIIDELESVGAEKD